VNKQQQILFDRLLKAIEEAQLAADHPLDTEEIALVLASVMMSGVYPRLARLEREVEALKAQGGA
jgi:hypothetical protein